MFQLLARGFRSWPPVVVALACLALARPAHAGSYQWTLQSGGSGSVSFTRMGGDSGGWSPTDPSVDYYSVSSIVGLSYAYSETWAYQWVPADGQTIATDPPQDEVDYIEADPYLSFDSTPDARATSGTGHSSATAGGDTAMASASAGPNGQGGTYLTTSGDLGPTAITVSFTATGASGTWAVHYSGSLVAGPVNPTPLIGWFGFARNPPHNGKWI